MAIVPYSILLVQQPPSLLLGMFEDHMKLIELRGKYTSTNLSMEEKVQAKDRIEQRNKLLERDVQRLVWLVLPMCIIPWLLVRSLLLPYSLQISSPFYFASRGAKLIRGSGF